MYLVACLFIMTSLKLLYADPRPYMTYEDILALDCDIEYGNPSGHSFVNCFYFLTLPWLYNPDYMKFY